MFYILIIKLLTMSTQNQSPQGESNIRIYWDTPPNVNMTWHDDVTLKTKWEVFWIVIWTDWDTKFFNL